MWRNGATIPRRDGDDKSGGGSERGAPEIVVGGDFAETDALDDGAKTELGEIVRKIAGDAGCKGRQHRSGSFGRELEQSDSDQAEKGHGGRGRQ